MKLEWKQRGSVDHEPIWGLIGLLAVTAAVLLPFDEILASAGYRCHLRAITGWPYPTYGATRAFVAAGHLQLPKAFALNPLATLTFLGLVAFVPYCLGTMILGTKRLRIGALTRREKYLILTAGVTMVLANWAYMILASPR